MRKSGYAKTLVKEKQVGLGSVGLLVTRQGAGRKYVEMKLAAAGGMTFGSKVIVAYYGIPAWPITRDIV